MIEQFEAYFWSRLTYTRDIEDINIYTIQNIKHCSANYQTHSTQNTSTSRPLGQKDRESDACQRASQRPYRGRTTQQLSQTLFPSSSLLTFLADITLPLLSLAFAKQTNKSPRKQFQQPQKWSTPSSSTSTPKTMPRASRSSWPSSRRPARSTAMTRRLLVGM